MSRHVNHLALDGSVVTIETTDGLDLDSAASSIGVHVVDGVPREFTASRRDFGRDVAADLGLTLDEAYSMQGGTLHVRSMTQVWPELDDDGGHITSLLELGVWEGVRYSLHAHVYGGESIDVIDLFSRATILETDLGIELIPVSTGLEAYFREPALLKDVPNLGLLDIAALATREARALPRWHGTSVPGGELFSDEAEGGGRYFVLVGGTSRGWGRSSPSAA